MSKFGEKVEAKKEQALFDALTWLIDGKQKPVVDPTSLQYSPTCYMHIGQRPWRIEHGQALCDGCWSWAPLVHGKVGQHEPGPPPFTECAYKCGWKYPKPAYNEIVCDACAIEIEMEHQLRLLEEAEINEYDDDGGGSSYDESDWA